MKSFSSSKRLLSSAIVLWFSSMECDEIPAKSRATNNICSRDPVALWFLEIVSNWVTPIFCWPHKGPVGLKWLIWRPCVSMQLDWFIDASSTIAFGHRHILQCLWFTQIEHELQLCNWKSLFQEIIVGMTVANISRERGYSEAKMMKNDHTFLYPLSSFTVLKVRGTENLKQTRKIINAILYIKKRSIC